MTPFKPALAPAIMLEDGSGWIAILPYLESIEIKGFADAWDRSPSKESHPKGLESHYCIDRVSEYWDMENGGVWGIQFVVYLANLQFRERMDEPRDRAFRYEDEKSANKEKLSEDAKRHCRSQAPI